VVEHQNEEWKFEVNDKGNLELTIWNETDSEEKIPDTGEWVLLSNQESDNGGAEGEHHQE